MANQDMATVDGDNSIIPLKQVVPERLFAPGGLDYILVRLATEARSLIPDVSTKKSRSEIASVAAKVARSKTYLDGIGKEYVADLKKASNAVDAERKKMRDFLDGLKDEIRAPLTVWESSEADRIRNLETAIASIEGWADIDFEGQPDKIKGLIARVMDIVIDESWQEFQSQAALAKDRALRRLQDALRRAEAYEEEKRKAAELARQAQAEREQRIAEESAQRARQEAEERAERERVEAQARADKEAKEIAMQALRQQQEAEARHRAELEAERRKVIEEQKNRDAEEQARQAEFMAIEQRAKDHAHREEIHNEMACAFELCGIESEQARKIVSFIVDGYIPHIDVKY